LSRPVPRGEQGRDAMHGESTARRREQVVSPGSGAPRGVGCWAGMAPWENRREEGEGKQGAVAVFNRDPGTTEVLGCKCRPRLA
jgi:hypothetical protein